MLERTSHVVAVFLASLAIAACVADEPTEHAASAEAVEPAERVCTAVAYACDSSRAECVLQGDPEAPACVSARGTCDASTACGQGLGPARPEATALSRAQEVCDALWAQAGTHEPADCPMEGEQGRCGAAMQYSSGYDHGAFVCSDELVTIVRERLAQDIADAEAAR